VTNGTDIATSDYAGKSIHQNNILQMISQPEGYLEPNGQGGYENQCGRVAVALEDFSNRVEGMSYNEIMTGSTRTLGIKHYSKLVDPKYSFIKVNMNGTMQEIDMVHFMVVGKLNQQFGLI
jgi:hypothetical protein